MPTSAPRRGLFLIVALLGFAHALLYVDAVPPWGIEDEEAHVDYVLALRDDARIPEMRDTISPSISESAIDTDRYTAFGLGPGPAPGTPPSELGLEGRSYEGYQPPLYYALMVPVAAPFGDDALTTMYALRVVNAMLIGLLAALAAMLAAAWAPRRARLAAFVAGSATALLPVVAESGSRATNDVLVAVLVAATLLACTRLLARPSVPVALLTGAAAAGAVLTKSTGLVTLLPVAATLALLWLRDERSRQVIAATLAPPVIAAAAWALVTRIRYGVWRGDDAFVDMLQPFSPTSLWRAATDTLRSAPFPHGDWSIPLLVSLAGVLVVLVGVALAAVDARTRPLAVGAFVVAVAILAGYFVELERGLVIASARLLVPAYPGLLAAMACGYAELERRRAAAVVVCTVATCAIAFFLLAFTPRFPIRTG